MANTQSPVLSFRSLQRDLQGAMVERDTIITGLLISLIAGEHILLLGPPGTGKSHIANAFAAALVGSVQFERLMTKFTLPEEVFGPLSLKSLENDKFERLTDGYLPKCDVAFLDEIFKANSAILNSLLTLLNERAFDNGQSRVPCPLQICIGASNELPQDDSLYALYDRFVMRYNVEYIKSTGALRRLMGGSLPQVAATITVQDIEAMRKASEGVAVPPQVIDSIIEMKAKLQQEMGITVSDRRWVKIIKLVKASAALDGRTTATTADLFPIGAALWQKPDDIPMVSTIVAKAISPNLGKAIEIRDACLQEQAKFDPSNTGANNLSILSGINGKLKNAVSELTGMTQKDPGVQVYLDEVMGLQKEIGLTIQKMVGI